jgi:hypothetical protein
VIFDSRLTYDKGGSIIHTLRFVTNNDSLWFNTLRGFQNTYKNSTASVIDFRNYYQAQTAINATQFFNQWYYGEGYPTFNVTWNFVGNTAVIKSIQTTSKPSSVPLYITPMQYKLTRTSAPDTIIRVMHSNPTEVYSIPMLGNVTSVQVDPSNWVINKTIGPSQDVNLIPTGITEFEITKAFSVSPNPSNGIFNFNGTVGTIYVVSDISGKVVSKGNCAEMNTIDIFDKPNGVYILEVRDAQSRVKETKKLVKK